MSSVLGACGALLLTTCVTLTPFQGIVAQRDGDGAVIFGSFFRLHFATDGLHLPDHLTLADGELLAPPTGCADPGNAGLLIAPALRIAAGAPPATWTSGAQIFLAGPAVAQVEVAWSVGYACDGAQTATGRTTFTAYPDGRVVRHDHDVRAVTTAVAAPSATCGCGGSGGFTIASYLAVARAAFDHLVEDGADVALPRGDGPRRMTTCLEAAGQRLAVAWPAGGAVRGDDRVVALVETLATGPLAPAARLDATTSFALDLGHQSCPDLIARLAPTPTLVVDRDPTTAHPIGPDGYVVVVAKQPGPVVLSSPTGLPPGFAVSIGFDRPAGDLAITRSPAVAGLSFFWQYDGLTDHYLAWFRDGLAPGETITIIPPG
jgi:hypothetical protein